MIVVKESLVPYLTETGRADMFKTKKITQETIRMLLKGMKVNPR